ncbi:hypothetical protein [Actinomadura terrae]|uniref:hypothetical protein n=1 Tax=Actinomadura terrae TaxID=604353 RepID=UPI001FA6FA17|nr:hypothetical protein [Actinomadura terrae]
MGKDGDSAGWWGRHRLREPGATGRPADDRRLVYVASMVMLDSACRNLQVPALAWFTLVLGNRYDRRRERPPPCRDGSVGAVIAAWSAVTLMVAVELLMGMIRHGQADPAPRGRGTVGVDGRAARPGRPAGWCRTVC